MTTASAALQIPRADEARTRTAVGAAAEPDGLAPSGQLVDKSVIHDLRNPLSAMGGNLQLLQAALEASLDDKNRSRLTNCMASLEELTGMLTDLQYLTLYQARELEPSYKPVDLRAVVGAVIRTVTPKAAQDGRTLAVLEGAAPCVHTTGVLLQRAIQNFVISALRISKASPVTIQIHEEAGKWALVVVAYQGMSVPAPVSDHLFDLHCGPTQKQHGLRVDRSRGLYFARVVAELHGGAVGYEPAEGGGRFVLRLPLHPPAA